MSWSCCCHGKIGSVNRRAFVTFRLERCRCECSFWWQEFENVVSFFNYYKHSLNVRNSAFQSITCFACFTIIFSPLCLDLKLSLITFLHMQLAYNRKKFIFLLYFPVVPIPYPYFLTIYPKHSLGRFTWEALHWDFLLFGPQDSITTSSITNLSCVFADFFARTYEYNLEREREGRKVNLWFVFHEF